MIVCKKQLADMGFIEISENLYMKDMDFGVRLFRDYREEPRRSYAYRNKRLIPNDLFNEFKALNKIEKIMVGSIVSYC